MRLFNSSPIRQQKRTIDMAESNPSSTSTTMAAVAGPSRRVPPAADKPICAICYSDLCALTELIQSIPVCGHVFHELCLQQWIDYCPEGIEPTCPVCKQAYSENPPTRLYFQSNDGSDTDQNSQNSSSAPPVLPQEAVIRMELRISALDARVQDVDYKVNSLYRESTERELALLVQMEQEEQLLNNKITELEKKAKECSKLKEKNVQLSKELSGLKSENKKLTSRCNILGRSETRTERKLDLATKQIKYLQERLEELEREQQGGELPPKKRKIETGLKVMKSETITPARNVMKTRSMSAIKDLNDSNNGKKIRVSIAGLRSDSQSQA